MRCSRGKSVNLIGILLGNALIWALMSTITGCGSPKTVRSDYPVFPHPTDLGTCKRFLLDELDYPLAAECLRRARGGGGPEWEVRFHLGIAYAEMGLMILAESQFGDALSRTSTSKDRHTVERTMKAYDLQPAHDLFPIRYPSEPQFLDFDTYPEIIKGKAPHYPEAARKAALTGDVIVAVTVDQTGSLMRALVVQSSDPVFDDPCVEAANQFKFNPATLNGKPVRASIHLPFRFDL